MEICRSGELIRTNAVVNTTSAVTAIQIQVSRKGRMNVCLGPQTISRMSIYDLGGQRITIGCRGITVPTGRAAQARAYEKLAAHGAGAWA